MVTQSRKALLGAIMLLLVFTVALIAPKIMPFDPSAVDSKAVLLDPNAEHLLGTDNFGRDLFSRIVMGSQISVGLPLLVVCISLAIGVPCGLIAGYFGGKAETFIMGVTNCVLCFPWILTTLALATIMGGSEKVVLIALGIGFVPELTRLVRGITLSTRERDFVDAAVVAGERKSSIIFRYILPNTIAPVVVQATIIMSKAVLEEAAISYLGYGVQPPKASWGLLLSNYSNYIWKKPLLCIAPGLAIVFFVLAANFFGDGLRDILDPRYKGTVNKL